MSANLADIVLDIFLDSFTPRLVYIWTKWLSFPPIPKKLNSSKEKLEKMFSEVS